MDERQSRVRWDDHELSRLAAAMAPRLLADPTLHPLDAARAAQEVLEPHRRRELKAWAMVEARLQPRLDAALARLRAQPSLPALAEAAVPAGGGEPAVVAAAVPGEAGWDSVVPLGAGAAQGEAAAAPVGTAAGGEAAAAIDRPEFAEVDAAAASGPVPDLFGEPAGEPDAAWAEAAVPEVACVELAEPVEAAAAAASAPAGGVETVAAAVERPRNPEPRQVQAPSMPDPLRLEAAVIAALQSPVVEAALVELFTRTLAQAVARVEAQPAPAAVAPAPKASSGQRVLLAGFPESQQKALTDALSGSFEVRSWKPTQGPQLFETLARLCGVVVVPEDADEGVDADLKDLDVRVVRHAGQASRLIERIEELV